MVSKDVLSWRFSTIRHHPKLRRVADSPTKHRPQLSVRCRGGFAGWGRDVEGRQLSCVLLKPTGLNRGARAESGALAPKMDPSHLFWQGIDPIAAIEDRVGGAMRIGEFARRTARRSRRRPRHSGVRYPGRRADELTTSTTRNSSPRTRTMSALRRRRQVVPARPQLGLPHPVNEFASAAMEVVAPVGRPHRSRPAGLAAESLRHPRHTEGLAREVRTDDRSSALRTGSCQYEPSRKGHPVAVGERDLRPHSATGAVTGLHVGHVVRIDG